MPTEPSFTPSETSASTHPLVRHFTALSALTAVARAQALCELAHAEPQLALQLQELFAAHTRSNSLLLDQLALARVQARELPTLEPGTAVGRYRIDSLHCKGGMGSVYRATRDDDTLALPVALKLARWTQPSSSAILHEAGLQERLRHPGIAQFYDALHVDFEHIALVIEWVDGTPLDQLPIKSLSSRQSLEIVIQLAQALAYAHERQVLHGDIKPSNVILAVNGRPKLIDFGLGLLMAKDNLEELPASGLTLGFSAPEILSQQRISTRSDVYSLGRLLLLLWGGPKTLPTTSQETHATELEQACMQLNLDPALRPADVAAVLRKALAHNPQQRYASSDAMAFDLLALARQEQPRASVWSAKRKLWQLLKSHPKTSIAALTLTFALFSFGALLLVQRNSLQNQSIALTASLKSESAARQSSERTLDFMLDSLAGASTESVEKANTTLSEFAEGAIRNVALLQQRDPETAARVATSLAKVSHSLERYAEVIALVDQHFSKKLSAQVQFDLLLAKTKALRELARFDESKAVLDGALWPPSLHGHWRLRQARAGLLRSQGQPAQAEALTRLTLAARPSDLTDMERINLPGEMVVYLGDQGKLDEALLFLNQQAKVIAELAPDAYAAGRNAYNRAVILMMLGKYLDAKAALRQAQIIYQKRLNPKSTSQADLLLVEVEIEKGMGNFSNALDAIERALAQYRAALGNTNQSVATALHTRGNVQIKLNQNDAALVSYQQAYEILTTLKSGFRGLTGYALCDILFERGHSAKALPLCLEMLEDMKQLAAPESIQMANAHVILGAVQVSLGQRQQGFEHLTTGIATAERSYPADSPERANLILIYTHALLSVKRQLDAEAAFKAATQIFAKQTEPFVTMSSAQLQDTKALAQACDTSWLDSKQGRSLVQNLAARSAQR